MSVADEIAHLRSLQLGWGEGGDGLVPTPEALAKATTLLQALDNGIPGHSFCAFPVEDGGVDLQATIQYQWVVSAEISPDGRVRDLAICDDMGVLHASLADEATIIPQIKKWLA